MTFDPRNMDVMKENAHCDSNHVDLKIIKSWLYKYKYILEGINRASSSKQGLP